MSTRLICLSGFHAKEAIGAMDKAWPINKKKGGDISEAAMKRLRELKVAEAKSKPDGRRTKT